MIGLKLVLDTLVYDVGQQVADMDLYRVYLCTSATNELLFLQIAKHNSAVHDANLEKSAYTLQRLKTYSDQIEQLFAEEKPGQRVGYDRMFPHLEQSRRTGEDQGYRMANILSVKMASRDSSGIDMMIPLSKIPATNQKVDEKTSVWIMGKFLKLLIFLHDSDITMEIAADNVLLSGPEQYHNVVLFDWSKAVFGNTQQQWSRNVGSAARTTLKLLNAENEHSFSGIAKEYGSFLVTLARGDCDKSFSDAAQVYQEFYEIADLVWGKAYHPMSIIPK